jgi:methyl-accepting chemotaxis protein
MRATIKLKLAITFTVIIALVGVMAWLGINSLSSVNAMMDGLIHGAVVQVQRAKDLESNVLRIVRAEKNMLLTDSPEQAAPFDTEIGTLRSQLVARLDKLQAIASGEGKQKLTAAAATMQQWFPAQDKIRDLAKRNGFTEGRDLSKGRVRELVTEVNKNLAELVEINDRFMDQSAHEAVRQYESARMMLVAATAIVLLVGAFAGIWISVSISRGLGRAVALAGAVAGGDLNQQVEVRTNDEVKDLVTALNSMVERLRIVVGDSLSAAENVSAGSQGAVGGCGGTVLGCDRAGLGRRGGLLLDGADGRQHQTERRQRNADREDRAPVRARRAGLGRGGEPRRAGNADHRREDHLRAGDCAPDRPAGLECRGGSRPGR